LTRRGGWNVAPSQHRGSKKKEKRQIRLFLTEGGGGGGEVEAFANVGKKKGGGDCRFAEGRRKLFCRRRRGGDVTLKFKGDFGDYESKYGKGWGAAEETGKKREGSVLAGGGECSESQGRGGRGGEKKGSRHSTINRGKKKKKSQGIIATLLSKKGEKKWKTHTKKRGKWSGIRAGREGRGPVLVRYEGKRGGGVVAESQLRDY